MKYDTLPATATVAKTAEALRKRNIEVRTADTQEEALAMIQELIPDGASVMNGSSRTLQEIGFVDHLRSGQHKWENLHEKVFSEKDPAKQLALRMKSSLADYFLESVHAVTTDGQLLLASNTGSQLAAPAYTARNIIFVVGTQKIVPSLDKAFERLREYVVPLEDARMKEAGFPGTALGKVLIFEREAPVLKRKIHLIFVNKKVGF